MLGFNVIEGVQATVDDALRAALQAASQAVYHAAQLCRWLGREDLACAHAAEGARLLAVDIHDSEIWRRFAHWLVAPAALARGFDPQFGYDELLSNDVLLTYKDIWPEVVNAIIAAPTGPTPRAREGAQAAFLLDLLELVKRLRGGKHRYGNEMWRLPSFLNGDPDRACDDDVPHQWRAINCIWMPWRGHEVPVVRAEIEAAGYPELATVLRAAGENHEYRGSRTVMGDLDKTWELDRLKPWQTQKVMLAVADFLERLIAIMECRSP